MKKQSLTVQIFYNLRYKISPLSTQSEERLVNLVRERESALLVYVYY